MGKQAFNARRGNLWQFDPDELVIIGIDTDDGPEHELYDERVHLPLREEDVLNYMMFGVKQSVTIRKRQDRPEVVDGRRRVLNAREANKRLKKAGDPPILVPAILEHGEDDHFFGLAISLNEIRVADDLVTKANKAVRLLQRNGNDTKAASAVFGVSEATIKNWIKFVELSADVKNAVVTGKLGVSAAIQLHGLSAADQKKELKALVGASNGKKKVTGKTVKRATGKVVCPGKRVLRKLINDEKISNGISPEIVYGIKVAIGDHVPEKDSKLGQLLQQVGYKY